MAQNQGAESDVLFFLMKQRKHNNAEKNWIIILDFYSFQARYYLYTSWWNIPCNRFQYYKEKYDTYVTENYSRGLWLDRSSIFTNDLSFKVWSCVVMLLPICPCELSVSRRIMRLDMSVKNLKVDKSFVYMLASWSYLREKKLEELLLEFNHIQHDS